MQLDFLSVQELWLGIGCQSGVSSELIQLAIEKVLQEFKIIPSAIIGIATIDSKAQEAGLVEFCQLYNLPLKTFSAAILSSVDVPNPANVVNKSVKTPSVAEAAAILATSQLTARGKLLVPKQILRFPCENKSLTVAIAKSAILINSPEKIINYTGNN
ncbi:MAG TPA: cobalamin biosynthesis protein [Nostocaceae cyanobacterium]|nr:cobalamin biosynthesis protein [Nostocaceae cyanobacterium]